MTIGMAVRERILQLCRERGITVNKLAVLSGVTQSTLNNIVGGRNHSTTVSTLQKVCDGLNITITEFLPATFLPRLSRKYIERTGRVPSFGRVPGFFAFARAPFIHAPFIDRLCPLVVV